MNPKQLARRLLPKRAVRAAEENYRKGRLGLVHVRYGLPARKLKVIAVTGTNGKTTTCNFINELLKSAGYKTAMFTTAVVEVEGHQTINHIHRTVPLTAELFKFLKKAADKKVDFVILEVTSHALHQHKVWGIPVEVAVMTNLTQDHLDYHGTMKNYALAKARLFGKYMKPKYCVLNRDDDWYDFFRKHSVGRVMSYGRDAGSSVRLTNLHATESGNDFILQRGVVRIPVHSPLIGVFNAYNAAAAACVGLVVGLPPEQISRGIAALEAVPGRMEAVDEGQAFGVIVDYAHAPDALENVLKTLQAVTKGRVIAVFGATGDRDKTKRPIMGQVAAKNADLIFLTDDETYSEDPTAIREAVLEGIQAAGGARITTVVADRLAAIKAAFAAAKAGDVVLLAGLGHQNYRAMNEGNIAWDEREVARDLLKSLTKK